MQFLSLPGPAESAGGQQQGETKDVKGAKGKIKARGAGGAKGTGTTQGPKARRGAKEAGKAGRDTAATPPQDDAPALGSALLRHKTGQSAGSCCYKAHLKKNKTSW